MRQHVSILGTLYMVFSGLGILAAFAALMLFGGIAGLVRMSDDPDAAVAVPILGIIGIFVFFLTLVISIPGLIVGFGLVKFRPWARVLGIVLSALNLLNFPFGTALGAYGLWALLNAETESLFA